MSVVVVNRVTSEDPSLPALIGESFGKVTNIPFDISVRLDPNGLGELETVRDYRFPLRYPSHPKFLDSIVTVLEREIDYLNKIYSPAQGRLGQLFVLHRETDSFSITFRENLITEETCRKLDIFESSKKVSTDEAKMLARRGLTKVLHDLVNHTPELAFSFFQNFSHPRNQDDIQGAYLLGNSVAQNVAVHMGTPVSQSIVVPDEYYFDIGPFEFGRFVGSCPFIFVGVPSLVIDEQGKTSEVTSEGKMAILSMIDRHVGPIAPREYGWVTLRDPNFSVLILKKSQFDTPVVPDVTGANNIPLPHEDGVFIIGKILEHLNSIQRKTGFLSIASTPDWLQG